MHSCKNTMWICKCILFVKARRHRFHSLHTYTHTNMNIDISDATEIILKVEEWLFYLSYSLCFVCTLVRTICRAFFENTMQTKCENKFLLCAITFRSYTFGEVFSRFQIYIVVDEFRLISSVAFLVRSFFFFFFSFVCDSFLMYFPIHVTDFGEAVIRTLTSYPILIFVLPQAPSPSSPHNQHHSLHLKCGATNKDMTIFKSVGCLLKNTILITNNNNNCNQRRQDAFNGDDSMCFGSLFPLNWTLVCIRHWTLCAK